MPLIDSAIEFSDASGPVRKATGCSRRRPVELGAGRIPLLAQPRDEHLRQRDPVTRARSGSARSRRYASTSSMVSMSGTGCSNSYIDALGACTWESISPGSTVLPPRSICSVLEPASFDDVGVRAHRNDAAVPNRHGFDDVKLRIDGHDLAVVEDVAGRRLAVAGG